MNFVDEIDHWLATRFRRRPDCPGHWDYFRAAFLHNLCHITPALTGFGMKLDPRRETPPSRVAIAACGGFWIALAVLGWWRHALWIGLAFFWISPLWAYTLYPKLYPDFVFEYRAYLAVLGWAVLVAQAPLWIGWTVVVLWAIQTYRRSFAFRTQRAYNEQALRENPTSRRADLNLKILDDFEIAKEITKYLDRGEPVPADIVERHHRVSEVH